MPRVRVQGVDLGQLGPAFDVCARCAADPEVLRLVLAHRAGVLLDAAAPLALDRLPHGSYDFAPKPVPCWSCARVLTVEDD